VFEKASRSRDKWFTVLYRANDSGGAGGSGGASDSCPNKGGGSARLGLAISKKYCRKATTRNAIKRIVRESFRQHQAELEGLDVVVLNRPAAAGATSRQLFDSLAGHWRRCESAPRASDGQE
ncbi:MAG: ribonuclease P protein component, partial [Woeseiaceae bacterium]|nr:ribonuclease P protein component [Woeseiaceae bacterium]